MELDFDNLLAEGGPYPEDNSHLADHCCPGCKGPLNNGDDRYLGTCFICYCLVTEEAEISTSPAFVLPTTWRMR